MTGQQIPSLTAKLQEQLSAQLAEAGSLTQKELTQLAATLKQQCSDALSTTDSVISAQRLQLRELQHEALATAEALKQTLTTARSITLSEADQYQIRDSLENQIKTLHAQAIRDQIAPMRAELTAVRREAEALSRTTAKSWLKPLALGAAVLTGTLIVGATGLKTADVLIAKRAEALQQLSSQIADQQMTLTRMQGQTWGVDLKVADGKRYIVLPPGAKPDARWTLENRAAVLITE